MHSFFYLFIFVFVFASTHFLELFEDPSVTLRTVPSTQQMLYVCVV